MVFHLWHWLFLKTVDSESEGKFNLKMNQNTIEDWTALISDVNMLSAASVLCRINNSFTVFLLDVT